MCRARDRVRPRPSERQIARPIDEYFSPALAAKWKGKRQHLAVSPTADELVVSLPQQFARHRGNRLRLERRNRIPAVFGFEIEGCALEIEVMGRLDDGVGGDGGHGGRIVREKEHHGNQNGPAGVHLARNYNASDPGSFLVRHGFKRRVWSVPSAQRQVSCVQPLGVIGEAHRDTHARRRSFCRWFRAEGHSKPDHWP